MRSPQEIPSGLDYGETQKTVNTRKISAKAKVDCVPAQKNALYLSVNVFSRKVLFGDTSFRRDRHFMWSSEPREGLTPGDRTRDLPLGS